jgi:protein-L-isoaspartate(D-aspartate) O-methyltransferase
MFKIQKIIKHILAFFLLLYFVLAGVIYCQKSNHEYESRRLAMVTRQIEARGVNDRKVLLVMQQVPRHLFVPQNVRKFAYDDTALPIGHDQTISQPYIVGFMTEKLNADTSHVVLEIGTGSGYQAAVLSQLVREVYTIEIIPELGNEAAATLAELGYENVTVKIGDGYQGWPEKAPFDRIIVTAAPEIIPPKLIEQLKPGGRMVIPKGPRWFGQDLLVVDKNRDDTIKIKKTLPVVFVPMVHPDE